MHQPTETRAHDKAAIHLAPSLGRPLRRSGHKLGHDHLDMPLAHRAGPGPGHRRGWLHKLRETLGLAPRQAL
jgi:hypothetical protein